MNVMTLYPYLYHGTCWVFDDAQTGLKEEAFVRGASEMISKLVTAKDIPNAERGFAMLFSDEPFDHDVKLSWLSADEVARATTQPTSSRPATGNWYTGIVAGKEMICRLCPALYEYFKAAPKRLFVKAEKLPAGIDPIWRVRSDDPQARRYMSAEPNAL